MDDAKIENRNTEYESGTSTKAPQDSSAPSNSKPLTEDPMAGIKDLAVGRSDIFKVKPTDLIRENNFNVRDEGKPEIQEHIRGLAERIRSNGFDPAKPIAVRMINNLPVIRDGHCRHSAVMQLIEQGVEIKSVPVVVLKGNETDDTLTMLNSNSGLELDCFEEAAAYKRLVSYGLTPEEIASKVGRSTNYVNERLLLCEASGELRDLVRAGALPVTAARDVVRAPEEKRRSVIAAAKEAKANGKKVSLKDAQRATRGASSYIPTGGVKKLLSDLQERALANPKDEGLRWQIYGVKLVLALA